MPSVTPLELHASSPAAFGWSGGQWSAARIATGALLLLAAAVSSAWASLPLQLVLMALGVAVAFGVAVRAVAIAALLVFAWLQWWPWQLAMVVLAAAPPAPFGSWPARHRIDPAGDFRVSPRIEALAQMAWGLGWGISLYQGLTDAFGIAPPVPYVSLWLPPLVTLPLALAPLRVYRWLWALGISSALAVVLHTALTPSPLMPAWSALGLIALGLFAFRPSWLPPRLDGGVDLVLYDGNCGLCHGFVRFVLAEDSTGQLARFAPLQGPTFDAKVPAFARDGLPDSVLVLTSSGELLVRSTAAAHVLRRLGGAWALAAGLLLLLPLRLRDAAYDGIAKVRHRLFRKPTDSCPLMPPALRTRFDP